MLCTEEKSDMNRQPSKGSLWLSFSLFLVALCLSPFITGTVAAVNLLSNPGFEEVADDLPVGWQIEQKNMHKGSISIGQEHAQAGRHSLELAPNDENIGARFRYAFPPHSVTAIEIHRAP